MKVLVTGATGFVGRALCAHLLQHGFFIRAASRCGPSSPAIPSGTEKVRIASVDGKTDWSEALAGVDVAVHLAARVHVMQESNPDPLGAFRIVNRDGTRRLAEMAAACGVRRMVFVSSIKVNGERTSDHAFSESDLPSPEDPYGISKWEAEQELWSIARTTGLQVVVVRPPMVYGPGVPGNFLRMLKFIRMGIPLPLGSVRNQRSLVYLENLCDAIRACVQHPAAGGHTFLVSDGEDVSTPELIRLLSQYLGYRSRLIPFPPALMRAAAGLVGFRAESERLLGSLRVDSSAIRQMLQWNPPCSLREGLRITAEIYRAASQERGERSSVLPANVSKG